MLEETTIQANRAVCLASLSFLLIACAGESQNNNTIDFLERDSQELAKLEPDTQYPEVIFRSHHNDHNLYLTLKKGEIAFARLEDVGRPIEICEDASLLICMDAPLSIYLPKSTKTHTYTSDEGTTYKIDTLIDPTLQSDKVCDSRGLWLRLEAENGENLSWYFFSPSEGLMLINVFRKFDRDIMEPTLNVSRKQGNIFTFDEICKAE